MRKLWRVIVLLVAGIMIFAVGQGARAQVASRPVALHVFKVQEGDYVAHDFHFKSGETLAELRLHYAAIGKTVKDANGRVTNAVLILHGTGGTGGQFLVTQFADVLFAPGQLLDAEKYFIILPDNIGHGKSSKPSDGMHAHFPQYDYDDMVEAQHELVEKGLGVNHLRLVLGTSMGCMHSWVWGEMFPDFSDALMPLACLPVQIAGRNRVWRDMIMDGIRNDPDWKSGEYTSEPEGALRLFRDISLIAGSSPIPMQKNYPTREDADGYWHKYLGAGTRGLDANDILFQFNSSQDYDPSGQLEKIAVPVMHVNSADDFINPPELGIAEREIQRVKRGKFVLIPASEQTHGHGTHTWAAIWQQYLKELLDASKN